VTTKREIIDTAYTHVGLASYVFDLTAEELQHARRSLDAMMAQWGIKGARVGYNAGADLYDESGLPDWAVDAAALNLGLRLAGAVGKPVMPETRRAARDAYTAVLTQTAYRAPMTPDVRQIPAGAGNRMTYSQNRLYLDETQPIVETGPDGALDLGFEA
jgi:hypothetical protein